MGLACLAIIVVLTFPLVTWRSTGCRINCVNNLKQVGLSFRTWALDNGDKYPMQMSTNDGGTREWVGTGSVFKHFLVMSNELSTPKILVCPQENDRRRTAATTFANTVPVGVAQQVPFTNDNNISYFVGVDATDSFPTMLLTGDRNLRVDGVLVRGRLLNLWTNSAVEWIKPQHERAGNIGFADGSVQRIQHARFREVLAKTGTATNRLDLP
jgi:prepilin-type processing-associated H-X9-DG protein